MSHNSALRLFSPAKINLFLHVTGRRPDGYHALQSLMVFADAGDDLEISPDGGFRIEVNGPFGGALKNPQENLVYKAALLLARHYKIQPRGKITLTKNLPVAAGIGGGSSNAAAALRGLAQLWGLPEEPGALEKIALQLGADVPACLRRTPVWAEGIGEEITPLPSLPPLHFVLVNPMVPTPTAEVFRNFRQPFSAPLRISGTDWKTCRNDLTEAAIAVTPAIHDVLSALEDTDGCTTRRLSGSGATCFGAYDSAGDARDAAQMLKSRYPEWWVTAARLLA